jgi:AhpD family alkylhydroperoxidase
MDRKQIFAEMEEHCGLVPSFFKSIPDATLGLEWELFKKLQIEENNLTPKEKELIGLGISAVTKCKYCTYFHTEFAKLCGATDAELQETVHYAKATAGWSAYINGSQEDFGEFKQQVDQVCNHLRQAMAQQQAAQ